MASSALPPILEPPQARQHAELVSMMRQMPGLYDQLKAQGDSAPQAPPVGSAAAPPAPPARAVSQGASSSRAHVPKPLKQDVTPNYEPSVGGDDSSREHEDGEDDDDDEDGQPGRKRRRKNEGGEEWARMRKDNHKEVERRRRGTINDGINELGRIVPNAAGDKAKGAILSRAVQYIHHLKENEARNIEKWTLEKLLMDQAMSDVQQQLDETRMMLHREREAREALEKELEALRRLPA